MSWIPLGWMEGAQADLSGLMANDVIMPSQYFSQKRPDDPYLNLIWSVVEMALIDYQRSKGQDVVEQQQQHRHCVRHRHRPYQNYLAAKSWLFDKESDIPFSCNWCLGMLNINSAAFRKGLAANNWRLVKPGKKPHTVFRSA